MKTLSKFSARYLVFLFTLFACVALTGPSFAESTETPQSFREKFSLMLDKYEVVFQQINNARGLKLAQEARQGMKGVTDEQLAKMFERSGIPDLSEAVKAAENLVAVSPKAETLPAAARSVGIQSLPFPDAPAILGSCDNIAHSSSFTLGALIAFQVARSLLEAAEFACGEVVVAAGFGGNGALACIPLAIAKDAVAIPYELADFCAGEEDSALLQGSYDRLEHIHNDLIDAQSAIINNANTNTTTIITNANTNTSTIINNDNTNANNIITNDNTNANNIITNDNTNANKIITNDNTNTSNIITNDNTNKDLIISEMRSLGCEIVRLLNTPEGRRASSILSCTGKPSFPYDWPSK